MKKTILIFAVVMSFSSIAISQTGKPSVKVFANYNSATEGDYAEFEVKRAYLGYGYKFDDKFGAKVTLDVGKNSGGSQYTAFLKVASLSYKASEQLTLDAGMIGAKNFKFMEKAWGKRYIEKSALDKNKWANSADVGVSGTYKISNMFSIDAQMVNGEGYKNTQDSDGLFRTGAGITIKLNDKLSGRIFVDNVPNANDSSVYDEQTITTGALVYKNKNYVLGAEMSKMENQDNLVSDIKRDLVSLYGSINMGDYNFFVRRDILSTDDEDVNETHTLIQNGDGTFQIFGVERELTKGLKISANMQSTQAETLDGETEAEEIRTFYINLEYKF